MKTTSTDDRQSGEDAPPNYVSLTLQLSHDEDGALITASDGEANWVFRLPPAILVARLHHMQEGDILRGSIGLAESDIWAPLQSSGALRALIRAWLEDQPKYP